MIQVGKISDTKYKNLAIKGGAIGHFTPVVVVYQNDMFEEGVWICKTKRMKLIITRNFI